MDSVIELINKEYDTTSEDASGRRFFLGEASENRRQEYILKKSTRVQTKLAKVINEKTKSFLPFASPSFVAEFEDKISRKLNTYNIEFSFSQRFNKRLEQELIESAIGTIDKELRNIRPRSLMNERIEARLEALGHVFITGKSLESVTTTNKYKKKVESRKRINNNKEYYAPLQSSSGLFISALSLQNTLNLLLHDTIQSKFMKSSSNPPNREYLRYQTGRFAKSAQVEQVTLNQNTLVIDFDYLTNPYETFKYGNHGINRDPERIIEGAIRDIMIRHVSDRFNAIIQKV